MYKEFIYITTNEQLLCETVVTEQSNEADCGPLSDPTRPASPERTLLTVTSNDRRDRTAAMLG